MMSQAELADWVAIARLFGRTWPSHRRWGRHRAYRATRR